jgi:EAL domain-containing protein (putative c-di-GMP-specific phosphodiesterase class I)/GGDEF domain-containing protein
MPVPSRSLRTRVRGTLLFLVLLVLGALWFTALRSDGAATEIRAARLLDLAGAALLEDAEQRTQALSREATLLAGDGRLGQALQDADRDALEARLAGDGAQPWPGEAQLLSLEGRLLVSLRYPGLFGQSFPDARMTEVARASGQAAGYVLLDGQAYQVVWVPVLAPRPVAWLVLGLPVVDGVAGRFRNMAGLESRFLVLKPGTQPPQAASTRLVKLDSDSDLAYAIQLHLASETTSLAPARWGGLVTVSLLVLLAAWYGGGLLSKGLVLPLHDLAQAVRRVGRGRYDTRVPVAGRDELATLAESFNRMAGDLQSRERQVTYLAYHDGSTGLPNRAGFVNQVDMDGNEGNLGASVMFLARLARLQDLGRALGTAVTAGLLEAAAQRIQGRSDWRAASLGEGTFAFLCPLTAELDRDDWEVRVRAVLEVPLVFQGQEFDLDLRLGSARYPEDGQDAETLLRRGEEAMCHGRSQVGVHVAWHAGLDVDGMARLAQMNELEQAIAAGQLVLYLQPTARLSDGRVVAAEALLRWRHPSRGLLLPAEFIPLAEQGLLIRSLTRWVIDAAAAQAAAWREAGRELPVSVNLSVRDLADHEVVERIANALARHQLPPSVFMVDFSESVLLADADAALGVLNAISSLGVRLALDDFGAGHTGLGQLARLPVSELKIERAFVGRLVESVQGAAVVKAAIDLAHTLGQYALAEGVEDEVQWQRLAAYGCDLAQGHYLSPPLEADDFQAWLTAREQGQ